MAAARGGKRAWEARSPRIAGALVPAPEASLVELAADGTVSGLLVEGFVDVSGLEGERVEIAGCRFARARLLGAEIDGWRLRDVEFDRCDLSGLVGSGAVIDAAAFRASRLSGCAWVDATVRDVVFTEVTAKDLALRFATLRRVVFDGCALPGLDLTEVELDHVTFRRCDLSGADFTRATVRQARFVGTGMHDVRGVGGLAGAYVEAAALGELAPALAGHAGLRLGSAEDLEALEK